jgi:hypothetical protein
MNTQKKFLNWWLASHLILDVEQKLDEIQALIPIDLHSDMKNAHNKNSMCRIEKIENTGKLRN